MGPMVKYLAKFLSAEFGKCPSKLIMPGVGLCPKIPTKWDGIRIDPAISEPINKI